MEYTPQEVLDRFEKFIVEIKLNVPVSAVFYREDYDDYQIVLDDRYHVELRSKLISIFMKNSKHADTRREIIYLLKHAPEYEDWEESPTDGNTSDPDIVLD